MNIEKILAEAPEGATHVDMDGNYFVCFGVFRRFTGIGDDARKLEDLREIQRLRAENEVLEKRLQDIQKEREVLFTKFHGYRDEIVELKISKEKALKYFNALSELWPDLPHSDTIFEEIVYLMKMRENKIRAQAVRDAVAVYKKEYVGQSVERLLLDYANELESQAANGGE